MKGTAEKSNGKWRMASIVIALIVLLALLAAGLYNLLHGSSGGHAKKPPKISLIPSAPPPPPPPPKEEKKPEPPKEQKEIKIDQPLEKREAAPPADPQLKMEGPAGDGPSPFAAGTITSEDLSHLGSGKTAGGDGLLNPFSSYAGLLKSELQRYLNKNNSLRRRQYRIEIRVWVNADGSLKHSELLGSSGDGDTDEEIRKTLSALPVFSEAPPANMPQPIRLRIVTSGRT